MNKLTFFLLSLTTLFCSQKHTSYEADIISKRKEKDQSFKLIDKSPLPKHAISTFSSLNYFDVDSTFHLTTKFILETSKISLQMATTTGEPRDGFKIGVLKFELNGKSHQLSVYHLKTRKGDLDTLYNFIPFTDETSGKESYKGGRYLDIKGHFQPDIPVILDFNLAYNPYCVYDDRFSCPIPPKENHLGVRIEAGEKNYP